jgi:hypothetical protein
MTATARSARQSTADHAGREARIEAVTRDLRAITEGYYVTVVDAEDFDRCAADRDPEP